MFFEPDIDSMNSMVFQQNQSLMRQKTLTSQYWNETFPFLLAWIKDVYTEVVFIMQIFFCWI